MLQQKRQELSVKLWQAQLKRNWFQGEHVALIGPTGTGKTTIAQPILECRDYVVALAVKKYDETLDRFKEGHKYGLSHYHVIHKWPPDFPQRRVIFWPKPEDIGSRDAQAKLLYHALNSIYMSGGWCIYFDEAGYIAGTLGMGQALGILLNQGRSSNISVVATMTRPSSVVAHVPKEALNQCRHVILFKYTDSREIKTCADISGVSLALMQVYQKELQWRKKEGKKFSDFLYIHDGEIIIVRND